MVQDDPDVARLVADYLAHLRDELRVETMTDQRAARAERVLSAVDCLVVGYRLAETDGLEVCRAVREIVPGLPCVVVSSEGPDRAVLESDAPDAFVRRGARSQQYEHLAGRVVSLIEGEADADENANRAH